MKKYVFILSLAAGLVIFGLCLPGTSAQFGTTKALHTGPSASQQKAATPTKPGPHTTTAPKPAHMHRPSKAVPVIHPAKVLPDLVVQRIWLDRKNHIVFHLKNAGQGAVPPDLRAKARIRLTWGGSHRDFALATVDPHGALSRPGGSVRFTTGIRMESPHRLTVALTGGTGRRIEKNVGNNTLSRMLTPKVSARGHKAPKGHLQTRGAAAALRPLPHIAIEKIFLKNGRLFVRLVSRENRRLTRADFKQARLVVTYGGRTFSWHLADIDRAMRMSHAARPLNFDTGIRVKTKVHVTAKLEKVSGHAVRFVQIEPQQSMANFSNRGIQTGRNIPTKKMDLPLAPSPPVPKGPNVSSTPMQAPPIGKDKAFQKKPGWSRYLPNLVLYDSLYENGTRTVEFHVINYGAPFIGDAQVRVNAMDHALAAADNEYTHQFAGGNNNTLDQSGIPFIGSKPFDWPSYACWEGFIVGVKLILRDGTEKSFGWEVEKVYPRYGPVQVCQDVDGHGGEIFVKSGTWSTIGSYNRGVISLTDPEKVEFDKGAMAVVLRISFALRNCSCADSRPATLLPFISGDFITPKSGRIDFNVLTLKGTQTKNYDQIVLLKVKKNKKRRSLGYDSAIDVGVNYPNNPQNVFIRFKFGPKFFE